MPNPGGANQLGGYELQPAYGAVKEQTRLLRSAPISGAPIAAHALETPRRAGKRAKRGAAPPQQSSAAPTQAPELIPQPAVSQALVWAQIAEIPGASPLVQQLALEAQRES